MLGDQHQRQKGIVRRLRDPNSIEADGLGLPGQLKGIGRAEARPRTMATPMVSSDPPKSGLAVLRKTMPGVMATRVWMEIHRSGWFATLCQG
jgi:hypothetical protein